jgi:hypothetical protein
VISDVAMAVSICAFLLCWLGAIIYAAVFKRASWADPIVQFLAFFALFVLPLPARALITQEIEGDVTKHLPLLLAYLPASVLLAALAIVCFVAAYYSDLGLRLARRIPSASRPRRDPYVAAIILVGISLILIALLTRAVGGILSFILLGYGSSALTFGQGYLAIGFPWLYVGLCFLLYRYSVRRQPRDLIIYALGFAVIAAMQMVLGNRSIVLYMILVTLLFVHFAIRPVSLLRLIPLAAGAFLTLNIAGFLRASHYESPAEALTRWQESFTRVTTSGDLRHGFFYTLTTGEFVVPFETMPQMIRSVGTELSPQWGRSFAASPLFFVPSVIFPNRPPPLTNWYMREFYGDETYGLNEGRAFFFLAEGYLNFGPVGIPLLAVLWGILWRATREYLTISRYNRGAVLLYAFAVAFMFRLIAGDSVSLLVGVAEQDLVPAILGLMMLGAWRTRANPPRMSGA